MAIDIKMLRSKDPLSDLTSDQLERIAGNAKITEHKKGDEIFNIGDTDTQHCYLVWGQVRLESEDNKVSTLKHNHDRARFALAKLKPRRLAAKADLNGTCILWVGSDVLDECLSEFRGPQLTNENTIIIGGK